uniref:DNA polymerase n=1 Tax=uncultured marine virus TaxID=186617 RepID=A0A0F7LA43_9VIRU|nr:DNA polymerase [uncultured marine virus]
MSSASTRSTHPLPRYLWPTTCEMEQLACTGTATRSVSFRSAPLLERASASAAPARTLRSTAAKAEADHNRTPIT